ncbi:hypothetical protein PFISCL1PPCAC_21293, partial [Pristionchus fissidentatus]
DMFTIEAAPTARQAPSTSTRLLQRPLWLQTLHCQLYTQSGCCAAVALSVTTSWTHRPFSHPIPRFPLLLHQVTNNSRRRTGWIE